MKVTKFYSNKIIEEREKLGSDTGPLFNIVCNKTEMIYKYGVENDFAGDQKFSINENETIIHKYEDRILVLITEKCIFRCAYCFREKKLETMQVRVEAILEELEQYISTGTEVKEIIVSGGDFMSLGDDKISEILEKINSLGVPNIRLHTRAIVFQPALFTERIIKLFVLYKVRLYFHIVHPYEICDEVSEKIREISSKVRCYNQFPLLRGVNDHTKVIKLLIEKLDNIRVQTLVMYIPDPINFLHKYRISIQRVIKIKKELNESSPSWMNAFRVVFDSEYGKVSVDNFMYSENSKSYFVHKDKIVEFPDIPKKLDVPQDIKKLLWRD